MKYVKGDKNMTISDKQSYIANFNCTFGDENKPMLDYFFDAILPALLEEEKNKRFIFENVTITFVNGEFVLAGIIVKRTKLEIKSLYVEGELVRTDETYPSDPYSYFLINLKNHRMVLTKNQNGSPTLVNFATAVRNRINKYITNKNKDLGENEEKIPEAQLNVVAIPFKGSIKQELKKVKKIKNVILRFYPLNEDIMDNETANDLLQSLEELGSGSASITYNTPDNKENVAQIIEETKGLMRPTIRVEYENGNKATLKDGSFTEIMNIPIDESESFEKNIDTISGKVIHKKEFTETSAGNEKIYKKYFTKIENWYNNKIK